MQAGTLNRRIEIKKYDTVLDVSAAILLMVGDLYANRERQGDKQYFVSDTFERLLNPYRVMEA